MSILLSDLLAPTTLPNAAGAIAPAAAKGETGAFSQVLAVSKVSGGAIAAPRAAGGVPSEIPVTGAGAQFEIAAALEAMGEAGVKPEDLNRLTRSGGQTPLDIDPAVLQRIQNGTAAPEDWKALEAAFEKLAATPAEESAPADTVTDAEAGTPDPVAPVAALAPASAQAEAALTTSQADNEEIALKIADEKRPYIPPRPDIPDVPQAKQAQEGRAATAAASAMSTIETQDASSAVKQLLESALPRAAANIIVEGAVKPQVNAPTQAASSAPLPQVAQAIAATPYVTSVQGTVMKGDATANDGAAEAVKPAVSSPQTFAANQSQAQTQPAAGPAATTAETAADAPLTPPAAEGEAVEAAMTALAKEKPETKPAAAQAAKPETAAPKTAEPEPAKPAAETSVRTQEAKSESKPDAQPKQTVPEKPAVTEKPVTPEARIQQGQPTVTDKPILLDASIRHAQQQIQNLPPSAIPQIAGEMAARFRQGATRFEIRLDPPDLGRVDVRIEVDADGKVHSRLMVEKSETLDLLKADQRALERALHEAGFKSEQNSLSFQLRDERGGHQKFAEQRFLREMNASAEPAEELAHIAAETAYRASVRGPGGIDMRV